MLSVTEISQWLDDITKAASKKTEPITGNGSHERRPTDGSLDVDRVSLES
jgi:hypothetical protein